MGKAAAWDVKKQRQHHAVSDWAMVVMENVNTNIYIFLKILTVHKNALKTAKN